MKYLVTARKVIVLDGVVRMPGELVEDPTNAQQLVRRGLAVPFGIETEQAEAFSPSPEPAPSTSEADADEVSGDGEAE